MNTVLLSYDVHDTIDHNELKKTLLKNGFKDTVLSDEGIICHLPNTSFAIDDVETKAVRAWFRKLVGTENIIRLMCIKINSWAGIVGTKHATDTV